MDMPDLPDFLRVENRKRSADPMPDWIKKARAKTARIGQRRFDLPKSIEPAGVALLKEIERARIERQNARLAALKQRRQLARRQRARV